MGARTQPFARSMLGQGLCGRGMGVSGFIRRCQHLRAHNANRIPRVDMMHTLNQTTSTRTVKAFFKPLFLPTPQV